MIYPVPLCGGRSSGNIIPFIRKGELDDLYYIYIVYSPSYVRLA